MTIQIYRMDDYEQWYAAESLEQAKEFYAESSTIPDDDEVWELDESAMDSKVFNVDKWGCWGLNEGKYSFRVALAAALADGETVPFLFAMSR